VTSVFAAGDLASALCGHLFQPLQRVSSWTVSLPRVGDAQTPIAPLPTWAFATDKRTDGLPGLLMRSGLDPSIPAAFTARGRCDALSTSTIATNWLAHRARPHICAAAALGPPVLRVSARG